MEYSTTRYRPEMQDAVAELMRSLWGHDVDRNKNYLRWKYHENPHAEELLAMVAVIRGEIVGFRGFMPTRWSVGGDHRFILLSPADTCVHPDHRRKGLSIQMGKAAMREYGARYPLFLNTSCSQASLGGYLKMGFVPLGQRKLMIRVGPGGILGARPVGGKLLGLVDRAIRRRSKLGTIRLDDSTEMVVSDEPMPIEMSRIASIHLDRQRFTLCQDEAFFRWRFSSGRRRYVFYTVRDGGEVMAYAVVRLHGKRRGVIVDYGGVSDDSLRSILRALASFRLHSVLSIWDVSLTCDLREWLGTAGFAPAWPIQNAGTGLAGRASLPFLVRPVKESFAEHGWWVSGLDTRRIDNWSIKAICSDDQ